VLVPVPVAVLETLPVADGRMIAIRVTVSSSMAKRGPSRPTPLSLTPP
jgi:hypothetical protein